MLRDEHDLLILFLSSWQNCVIKGSSTKHQNGLDELARTYKRIQTADA